MDTLTSDNFTLHPELKRLLRALELCEGFGLYFARCNTVSLRNKLVATLKTNLAKPIIELSLNIENDIFIDAQMAQLLGNASDDTVVFIYDLEKLFYLKDRHIIQELNWRRGEYGRLNHPVVFWLPEFLVNEIFNEAPDFSDWYSGIYEFSLSQPERLNLMDNTWQTVNENFVGQLSLQEKERWIINLKNLLAEIDEQDKSRTKSQLLNRLGLLYDSLGKYDKALTCYQQNLKILQTIGDKEGEGVTLNNIASIYQAKGDYDTALRYLTDSLKIQQAIGDKEGEGATLNNISQIYDAKGDYDTALRYLIDSLKIRQSTGDKEGEGVTLSNISQIHKVKGDYDTALRYLTDSLKITKAIGDKQGEGTVLNNISSIYQIKGDYDTALRYLTNSLKIQQDIGYKEGEGVTLNNLATNAYAKGDYDTALGYLTASLKISKDIGDKTGECVVLFNIGYIYRQTNQQDLAIATWLQAYQIAKQIGSAQALAALEDLAKELGGEGLEFWETLSQATPDDSIS